MEHASLLSDPMDNPQSQDKHSSSLFRLFLKSSLLSVSQPNIIISTVTLFLCNDVQELVVLLLCLGLFFIVDVGLHLARGLEVRRRYESIVSSVTLSASGFGREYLRALCSEGHVVHVLQNKCWIPMPKALLGQYDVVFSSRTFRTIRLKLAKSFAARLCETIMGDRSELLRPVETIHFQRPANCQIPSGAVLGGEDLADNEFDLTEEPEPAKLTCPRSSLPGSVLASFSQRFEWFSVRFLLIIALLVLGIFTGVYMVISVWEKQMSINVMNNFIVFLFAVSSVQLMLVDRVITWYGNAYLSCVSSTLQRMFQCLPICEDGELTVIPTVTLRDIVKTMQHHLQHKVTEPGCNLVYAQNPMHTLGTMTVLATPDNIGILTEAHYHPTEIFVPNAVTRNRKEQQQQQQHRGGGDDEEESSDSKEEAVKKKKHDLSIEMVLDSTLQPPLQFASKSWKSHIDILKPLGWSCLAHSQYAKQQTQSGQRESSSCASCVDETVLWGRHLFMLAQLLGFDPVAHEVKILRKVHTSLAWKTERQAQQASSLVVEDADGRLHLLCMGSLRVVLQWCKHSWDGNEVCDLTDEDKTELFDTKVKWERSRNATAIAVVHRPIPDKYSQFVRQGRSKDVVFRKMGNGNTPGAGNGLRRRHSHEVLPTCTPEECEDIKSFTPRANREAGNNNENKEGTDVWDALHDDMVLLSVIALERKAKPQIDNAIQVLSRAGIRFMYFDSDNEFHAKAVGSRLSLETDWNCCISLAENRVVLDPFDVRAHMPYGITRIRQHLTSVDNVPLLVSLFSDCTPHAVKEMISILQDNHEIVGIMTSAFNHSHVPCAIQSDFAISVVPTVVESYAVDSAHFCDEFVEESNPTNTSSITDLIGVVSAVRFKSADCVLPKIISMIRESRILLLAWSMCQRYILSSVLEIVFLQMFCLIFLVPPILRVTQIQLYFCVCIPLLTFGVFYQDENLSVSPVMKMMPNKYNFAARKRIIAHFVLCCVARSGASLIAIFVTHVLFVTSPLGSSTLLVTTSTNTSESSSSRTTFAQDFAFLTLIVLAGARALCGLSRHQTFAIPFYSFRSVKPQEGRRRLVFPVWQYKKCVLLVVLETSVSTLTFFAVSSKSNILGTTFPYVWLLPFVVVPILFIVSDFVVKKWSLQQFTQRQKYRALDFHTKLGMHSPCGDWEAPPEAPTPRDDGGTIKTPRSWWVVELSRLALKYLVLDYEAEENCCCCGRE